jgi:hypothetical protein
MRQNYTEKRIEKDVAKLYKEIDNALNNTCPKAEVKSLTNNSWFNEKLKKLRKTLAKDYKRYIRNKSENNEERFRETEKEYKKLCSNTRKESFQKYVSDLENVKQVSNFYKAMNKKKGQTLNRIKNADGEETKSDNDTVNQLFQAHFPEHTELVRTSYKPTKISAEEIVDSNQEWINKGRIIEAINGFKAKKSPGPDELKPIVLKYLPENVIDYLATLYKACVQTNFTPTKWKDTKVIFIPKPGKTEYDKPKSYRPISLSNYLLKTLERLVVWRMERQLIPYPIHNKQHGFLSHKVRKVPSLICVIM